MGFVVNIKGEKSHDIIDEALTVLENLSHRGASGADENTGDGAGILIQISHDFNHTKLSWSQIFEAATAANSAPINFNELRFARLAKCRSQEKLFCQK